jgi:hypothetical protein
METQTNLESVSPLASASPALVPVSPIEIITIVSISTSNGELVELRGSLEGEVIGGLFVPSNLSDQLNTTLVTSLSSPIVGSSQDGQVLASAVLNITLLDGEGNSITQLDSPLTICLAISNNTKNGKRVCLSYYDERASQWRCEDKCLTSIPPKESNSTNGGTKEGLLCGQTDHLTNFALLLTGSQEQDPCQSGKGNVFSWISLGLVVGAILVVALSVVIFEIHFRWRHYKEDRYLTKVLSGSNL